jgi:hypothetical protein
MMMHALMSSTGPVKMRLYIFYNAITPRQLSDWLLGHTKGKTMMRGGGGEEEQGFVR